jgi:hypothetical protein
MPGEAGRAVRDRGLGPRGGDRPNGKATDAFAAFCGALPVGFSTCEAADPESKGILERFHRLPHSNFEPGRSFRLA